MSQRKKRNKRAPKRGKNPQPSPATTDEQQEDLIQTVEAATVAVRDGDVPTVRRLVDHLREHHPEHYRTYSFRAQVAIWDGEEEEAVRLSREAMARGGDTIFAVVARHLEILNSYGLHEEVLEILDNEAAQWSDHINLLRHRYQALRGLHRRMEARDFLENQFNAGRDLPPSLINDLAMLAFDLGDKAGGMGWLRKALEKSPQSNLLWSNLLMLAHYRPDLSLAEIDDIYREWREACIDHLPRNTEFERDTSADRPLRIGFVSNGFLAHPAGWMSITGMRFLADYFDHELFLYSIREGNPSDPVANRFREIATCYTNIAGWSHQEVHDQLLDDELDLLVEMAGHSERNVLPAVAQRVAPVQVKWVGGLFDTSALPTMDYLLTDAVETPPGSEYRYTEQFIRLPGGYVSYTGPSSFPEINHLPALQGEPFTFGCLNNLHKFNETVAELWSSILTAVPGSRLLLKDRKLDDPGVRQWVLELFAHFEIDSERLVLEGGSPHRQLLETYNRIDVALDPWPYTGGLTTVEALMMGVPVITCPSETFAGRHAASHLQNVGLGDFIARDFSQYRALAISCSREPEAINQLRQSLRSMVRKAPLSQYLQFATNLDSAFRAAWGRWCRGEPPSPINFSDAAQIPEDVLARARQELEVHSDARRHGSAYTQGNKRNKKAIKPKKKLMGENFHIMLGTEEKHLAPFINVMDSDLNEFSNHYALIGAKDRWQNLVNGQTAEYFSNHQDLKRLEDYAKQAKRIFFHGLWVKETYNLLQRDPALFGKTFWMPWGGDFYFPETQPKEKNDVIKKIGNLVTYVDYDVEYLRDNYGAEGIYWKAKKVPVFHDKKYEDDGPKNDNLKIIVGNSSFPTNNHLEAFNSLKGFNNENISIYAPLSYGSSDYAEKVTRLGHQYFGDKFRPVTQFMAREKYKKFLSEFDIAILAHDRQQALAMCYFLLGMGKKLYLKRESPNWKHLTKIGFIVHDLSKLRLTRLENSEKDWNIKLSRDFNSPEKFKNDWQKILSAD